MNIPKEVIQGIYMIKSTASDYVYIGSSKNIYRRFREHINKLKQGKHHSWKLQKHYDEISTGVIQYKLELFVLEQVDNYFELHNKEIEYILRYDSVNKGFNCVLDSREYGRYLQRKDR